MLQAWTSAGILSEGGNILGRKMYGMGTNESAENKNRTAKSVNVMLRF